MECTRSRPVVVANVRAYTSGHLCPRLVASLCRPGSHPLWPYSCRLRQLANFSGGSLQGLPGCRFSSFISISLPSSCSYLRPWLYSISLAYPLSLVLRHTWTYMLTHLTVTLVGSPQSYSGTSHLITFLKLHPRALLKFVLLTLCSACIITIIE